MEERLFDNLLPSNIQNPYFLWDGSTRGELVKYLEEQSESKIRTGNHVSRVELIIYQDNNRFYW